MARYELMLFAAKMQKVFSDKDPAEIAPICDLLLSLKATADNIRWKKGVVERARAEGKPDTWAFNLAQEEKRLTNWIKLQEQKCNKLLKQGIKVEISYENNQTILHVVTKRGIIPVPTHK